MRPTLIVEITCYGRLLLATMDMIVLSTRFSINAMLK